LFRSETALISLYGLTADVTTVEQQFEILSPVLPTEAFNMVVEQIRRKAQSSHEALGWSLLVSIAIALWRRRQFDPSDVCSAQYRL
jgi:membrane protein